MIAAIAAGLLLSILAGAAFVGFLIYDFRVNEPAAAECQARLEAQFEAVRPMPGASSLGLRANHKTQHALVGTSYRISASYAEIRAYYEEELGRNGWLLCGERPLRDWGRDLGGVSVSYHKGEDIATLQYAGAKANYGWDYALDLSWGLHSRCGD